EKIGIEPRLGDEREHVSGRRLDRDQRASPVAERLLGGLLQPDIQSELQVVAGDGWRPRQRANGAAAGVDLDLFPSGGAVQAAFAGGGSRSFSTPRAAA